MYLGFTGGLRLLEVWLPEDEDDRDLDLDDEEPVYEDEPVVTDGDAAFGFTAGFAIALALHQPHFPLFLCTCWPIERSKGYSRTQQHNKSLYDEEKGRKKPQCALHRNIKNTFRKTPGRLDF